MSKQKKLLERRKGQCRDLAEKALRVDDLEESKEFVKELSKVIDQITWRAGELEDKLNQMEVFIPQTMDFSCPSCSFETQFSMPGSDWWREQTRLARQELNNLKKTINEKTD